MWFFEPDAEEQDTEAGTFGERVIDNPDHPLFSYVFELSEKVLGPFAIIEYAPAVC